MALQAFGAIAIHARPAGTLQRRAVIAPADDPAEHEADRMAQAVLAPATAPAQPQPPRAAATVQRSCACAASRPDDEWLQRRGSGQAPDGPASAAAQARLDAVGGGAPLTGPQQALFAPRFGADFSRIRIHTDARADRAARAVGALAYTRGRDIVFRSDQYRPETSAGRLLLAHELAHTVQQGAAPALPALAALAAQSAQSAQSARAVQPSADGPAHGSADALQRLPGTGMAPPGDCGWADYAVLRGAVESAKAVVQMVGACRAGDSCMFVGFKIAAITAEIAARVALDTTCFRGGDAGHREQVQAKVNMLNRCYQFFSGSGCDPELVARMAVVVSTARAVIAAAAIAASIVAVIALLVVLVAAIIALVELLVALAVAAAAAAAEAALIASAAAVLLAMLAALQDGLGTQA